MTATCKTCRHFTGDKRGGECRAHPPTMALTPTRTITGMEMQPGAAFPPVTAETWCGEHKETEARGTA